MRVTNVAYFITLAAAALLGACYTDGVTWEVPWCTDNEGRHIPCADADAGPGDAGTSQEGDGATQPDDGEEEEAGADDAGPPCEGECVPLRPTDYSFTDPHHVWFGPAQNPAACASGMLPQFVRYAGLVVPPLACPDCTCGASTGACAPPSTFVAQAAICDLAAGSVETSFAPPDAWDGACTAENAVPADLDCEGAPCIQSIAIGPVQKLGESCAPTPPSTLPIPATSWEEVAIACEGLTGMAWAGCEMDEMCVPKAAPGFHYCVAAEGDVVCPTTGYSERHLFYRNKVDTRTCAACSCGPVEGSSCTATATVFKDDACGVFLLGTSISSEEGACVDMSPEDRALGSKRVTDFMYDPGACAASGGGPEGTATPTGPVTFCCEP
ncbi:hypothetical protein [Polyangium sorediatum]|uniref:Lipoprotein n=1 Tax=Polyangium sorediatum TaxID=889274 RepID=A0ABT6NIS3_9BACT|nr:hypothetical protein [Polyangium sorediatum]MDI1428202.1 hypothetical protein [Polyangium sorediatum]